MLYTELPFELHLEVSAYLDKRSLKSLRIAFPLTTVSTAAFSALYRTFAIRLGTPRWSMAKLHEFSSLCDGLPRLPPEDRPLDPLAAIRDLVIDTRHPYMVKEMDCITRYLTLQEGVMELPPYESPAMAARGEITEYQKVVPWQQLDVFVEIVAKMVNSLPLLRRIWWRFSSDLPMHIQMSIAAALCPPGINRRYLLDVYLDLDPSSGYQHLDLRGSMKCLSDLHSFALRGMKRGALTGRTPDAKHPIAELIQRSPNLKSFFMDARVYSSLLEPIAEALSGATTLEHLENAAVELEGILDLDWTRVRHLKKLAMIVERAQYEDIVARDNVFFNLMNLRHQLQYLRVNAYNDTVKNYLLQGTSFLVALDIECMPESSEYTGPVFWSEVVPTHAPTLKSLKVSSPNTGSWCWLGEMNGLSKRALERCGNLEELAIGFTHGRSNFLGEMVDNLAVSCPKLAIIDMRFYGKEDDRYAPFDLDSLATSSDILEDWKSHDPCFAGRVLQVRYKMVFENMRTESRFQDNLGERKAPPVWFDFMLQSWQIFGHSDRDGRQIYRFGRLDDIYAFDDDLAEAHFGAPVDYFLHF
ncbi:hypothetical protein ABW21_db0204998 [Orbilia brochopaga]|nr:hypothetical protein ABW21_db0204998 [Drechslerella brochopaga]